MTNQNADIGKNNEELFCREIVKDPKNIRKIIEAFSEVFRKTQK